jgi:EAL domain-containing protein (putative c-di-GMP-specific phosphodiesterase class I)
MMKEVAQISLDAASEAISQKELNLRDANRVVDKGLLQMHYQPIVDLRTRKVFAQEALCRPNSERLKSPVDLVAAAVQAGRIGELGRLQRLQAVKNCPDWPLFLNIEPHEFDQGWLVRPDDPLFRHRKPVYLEITETVPLKFFEQCHSVLAELREKGVLLAIDDLGAGFSNLKYITELEPDIVKLDRELVKGVGAGTRQFDLLESITKLCHQMRAKVVAEGIETEEELTAVIQANVDYCQGYLLARPALPPPAISFPQIACSPAQQRIQIEHRQEADSAPVPEPADREALDRAAKREEGLGREIRELKSRLEVSERLREATARRLEAMNQEEARKPPEDDEKEPIEHEIEHLEAAPRPPSRKFHFARLTVPFLTTAAVCFTLVILGTRSSSAPLPIPAPAATNPLSSPTVAEPTAPEPNPPPQDDLNREAAAVSSLVAAWAEAWSNQSVVDYLGFYSDDFQPQQGRSRKAWEQDRHQRIGSPNSIEVNISELTITRRYPDIARAEFIQSYESDSYRDEVRKILLFANEDGNWKIIGEAVAESAASS